MFSFPSRGRGINNRTRGGERERGSSNYTTAGVILSRLRRSSINFRKHVSMHVDRHFFLLLFNYRPANEIIAREEDEEICILLFLFFFSGFSNFSSNLFEYIYIYERLIRILQASWRDCKQLRSFLRGPFPSDQLILLLSKLTGGLTNGSLSMWIGILLVERYCF